MKYKDDPLAPKMCKHGRLLEGCSECGDREQRVKGSGDHDWEAWSEVVPGHGRKCLVCGVEDDGYQQPCNTEREWLVSMTGIVRVTAGSEAQAVEKAEQGMPGAQVCATPVEVTKDPLVNHLNNPSNYLAPGRGMKILKKGPML